MDTFTISSKRNRANYEIRFHRSNTGLGSISMQKARWLVIHVQLSYINVKHQRSIIHAQPVLYTVTASRVAGQSVTGRKTLICFVFSGGANQTCGHPRLKLTCCNSTHQPGRHGHVFSKDTWGSNSLSQIRGSLQHRAGFLWH